MKDETPSLWREAYLRERRGKRWLLISLSALSVLLVLGAIGWTIFYSPLFRINEVKVVGNEVVSTGEITDSLKKSVLSNSFFSRYFGTSNILFWPDSFPSGELVKSAPELKSVSMEKDYKKREVKIIVEERKPFGVWCLRGAQTDAGSKDNFTGNSSENPRSSATSCFWFDSEGFIFRNAVDVEGSVITSVSDYSQKDIGIGSKILPERFVENAFSVFRALSQNSVGVKEIRLNDIALEEIEVDTYEGPKIYFSLRFPLVGFSEVFSSLAKNSTLKNLQYIDFRVYNRAYYK